MAAAAPAPASPGPAAPEGPRLAPVSPWWWVAGVALLPLAVLLAPSTYHLLVGLGWLEPDRLAFAKVLRRCLLVPIAVLVLGGLRPWRDVGLSGMGLSRAHVADGLRAFLLCVLAVLALLAVQVQLGWLRLELNEAPGRVAWRIAKTLGTGVVVGMVEEWLFRAWLPRRLGRRMAPALAAGLALLAFAALHAFRPSHLREAIEPSVAGAWEALGLWLGTLVDPAAFGASFLGLLLFGALLQSLYRRTGTLWAPIGVHAAAAWLVFAYGGVTERAPTPAWAGSKALYDGPLGWGLLLLALLLVRAWPQRRVPAG
ncbi:MAG: type II CAAX prenyl endopeptidase Rce1 family protein [Planctomycetia bacterium]